MIITSIGEYQIYLPTSGGKAGKNKQKTSSIQIRKGGLILKQYRFDVNSDESRRSAVAKAKKFIAEQTG